MHILPLVFARVRWTKTSQVVERHSALLNIPSEYEQIGLEADHRQMCKPPDRSHPIYETIAQRVITIMNRQIEKGWWLAHLRTLGLS